MKTREVEILTTYMRCPHCLMMSSVMPMEKLADKDELPQWKCAKCGEIFGVNCGHSSNVIYPDGAQVPLTRVLEMKLWN